MSDTKRSSPSMFEDELVARWSFLDEESEPCAVVSDRMEVVYLNRSGRALGSPDWFGKRCFEVLPVTDAWCALHCPTIKQVNETREIAYCQETFRGEEGADINLGGAIIPVTRPEERQGQALLVLRRRDADDDEKAFRERLLADAGALKVKVATKRG